MVTGEKVRSEGRSKKEVVSARSNWSMLSAYWIVGRTIFIEVGGTVSSSEVIPMTRVVELVVLQGSLWSRSSSEIPVEVYLGEKVSSSFLRGRGSTSEMPVEACSGVKD